MYDFVDIIYGHFIKVKRRFCFVLAFARSPSTRSIWSILKMIHQISCSLDTRIGQFTNFLWVEPIPTSTIKLLMKFKYKFRVYKVDKSIANIASVVVINRKIEKINLHFMISTNLIIQHLFRVFIRNMPYHQCSSTVWFNLSIRINTLSETILYSLAYYPETVLFFLWGSCRW